MLVPLYIYLTTTIIFAIIPLTYIQLEGYRPSKNKKYIKYFIFDIIFSSIMAFGCFFSPYPIMCAQMLLLTRVLYFFAARRKHYVFTKRGARLFLTTAILQVSIGILLRYVAHNMLFFHFALMPIFAYFTPMFALLITAPIENYIIKGYIKKAKEKLIKIPIRIGVTGSAGKTSVKNILKSFLRAKYTVFTTKENFNTEMGIVKSLEAYKGQEVFIAEMGAKRMGDIASLIDMVKPNIGVLTTVNEQHLETFKNVKNIVKEKTLLVNDASSFSVVNVDNIHLKDVDFDVKTIKIGKNNQVFYTNLKSDIMGTSFVAHIYRKSIKIVTPLLGEKAADNLLAAMTVAYRLGVDLDTMQEIALTLEATPHRLQKIVTSSGVTILDDGYNSNVDGVKSALKIIATHKGRKIICSQGIVEQGKKQKAVNIELGHQIAKIADIIITLSINAKYIEKGALDEGFSKKNIYVTKDLTKATELFSSIVKRGDLVYLQNDIPKT